MLQHPLRHTLRNSDVLEQKTEQIQSRTEQKEDSCAVASQPAPALGHAVIGLPTNRFESLGEEVLLYEPFVEEMQGLYPAADVRGELRAMRGWLITNTDKRKTKAGMKRFVNGWLSKAQNRNAPRETIRGNGNGQGRSASAHDKFNTGVAQFIQSLGSNSDRPGEGESGGDADGVQCPVRTKSMKPRSMSTPINFTLTRCPMSAPSAPWTSFPSTGGWKTRTHVPFGPAPVTIPS